jgi:hypothetical protein
MMARESTVAAIEAFVQAVPEVEPLWREHLRDNGEALPHVFFGEVPRLAVQVAERDDVDLTERFARAIEDLAASENEAVVNVIHVSFAENLVWGDDREQRALAELRESFGPATLTRFAEFEEWAAKAALWESGTSEQTQG